MRSEDDVPFRRLVPNGSCAIERCGTRGRVTHLKGTPRDIELALASVIVFDPQWSA